MDPKLGNSWTAGRTPAGAYEARLRYKFLCTDPDFTVPIAVMIEEEFTVVVVPLSGAVDCFGYADIADVHEIFVIEVLEYLLTPCPTMFGTVLFRSR